MRNLYRYGKRIKNLSLFSKKVTEGVLSGNYRSAFRGGGLEFDEVREYVPGDYLPVSSRDIQEMYTELMTYASSIENPYLKRLTDSFFVENHMKIKLRLCVKNLKSNMLKI